MKYIVPKLDPDVIPVGPPRCWTVNHWQSMYEEIKELTKDVDEYMIDYNVATALVMIGMIKTQPVTDNQINSFYGTDSLGKRVYLSH